MPRGDPQLRRDLLGRVRRLSVWRRGDQRAPHKPLLFLLALSRVLRGEERLVAFAAIEGQLADLLQKYGPRRANVHPEYPFWWLQSDGLWEVIGGDELQRRASSDSPTRTALRASGVGGFPAPIDDALRRDRRLVSSAVRELLDAHFPASLHAEILSDIGIEASLLTGVAARDPIFRREVIAAYEHRCAVCGFDIRIGSGTDLALEAAHVKWHQAGGPAIVQNGLALCSIHHKALDFGAIGIDDDRRVILSGQLYGQSALADWFLSFHRRPLRAPHSASAVLAPEFVTWHRREVFQAPARE